MNINDDDGISESETTFTNFNFDHNIYDNDSESDDDNCKFNSSLDWQCVRFPYESLIFGWGNTVDGELGLGGIEEHRILFPRQVKFHNSENIKRHTLTLIPSRGRVYAFGLGGVGQLGNKMAKNSSTPQVVIGPWLPDNQEKWYKGLNNEHFERLVLIYKNVFIDRLKTMERNYVDYWDPPLIIPLEVLAKLNILNKFNGGNTYEKYGGFKVPYNAFYISELSENIDIRVDYVKWVLDNPKMQDAMNSAVQRVITTMFLSPMNPAAISQYLDIHVSRNSIVEDTIRELSEHPTSDLKKPLRVHFLGEEAEDAGGVRKEFFMLVLKDILDPKYGILCGLAIYNFTIINIPFPLAMYKKLLNEPVKLHDVKELSPTLHKHEFVELYVDMILNKLVEARFREFSKGFHKVCGGRVLQLFHAQELMSVVIGNEDYDWYQLENNATYKKGYNSSDPTIRMFWEVFHELPLEDKKKFLLYLTGSDRIPIQGMKAIKVIFKTLPK
ncbi:hypothetical protein PGB90_006589 [Kerria lacca]